jgi:hypothetical protein
MSKIKIRSDYVYNAYVNKMIGNIRLFIESDIRNRVIRRIDG